MTRMTVEAVKPFGLGNKDAQRCKNMWALGLVDWLFGRDRTINEDWLKQKFARKPDIADANIAALHAGHAFGETADMAREFGAFVVPPADIEPGTYRALTGAEGVAMGLVAGARLAGLPLLFTGYPITPASALLHLLGAAQGLRRHDLPGRGRDCGGLRGDRRLLCRRARRHLQFRAGHRAQDEAIGLAIATELPLVIVNSQRGGPSTGLPTKTEQSDLYQAVYGRNADAPLAVVACHSPGDAYFAAIEACRLAVKYMTPVMFLTDGYISQRRRALADPGFRRP